MHQCTYFGVRTFQRGLKWPLPPHNVTLMRRQWPLRGGPVPPSGQWRAGEGAGGGMAAPRSPAGSLILKVLWVETEGTRDGFDLPPPHTSCPEARGPRH